nr:uncharacterized protein CTRU02_15080 [Colletotrichum truncatum]KAF6781440.1 hypothetical protein CTRU02_15080 [Colletotrichum truncatum]
MTALTFSVAAIAFWMLRLRSPPLPVPIITSPDHPTTITRICDVYKDYLAFSSATRVQTLYEALGLDATQNPGIGEVWAALRERVESDYYADSAPADDGTSSGWQHEEKTQEGDGKGNEESGNHVANGHGLPPSPLPLPPSPPIKPKASEVWAQIGDVLIDTNLRTTYDQAFMSVLTGLGVDRTVALRRICRLDEE